MIEMVYKPKGERVLLDRGIYRDHEYFVISLGTHPCAYIKLNGEPLSVGMGVPCHGGVTFTDTTLNIGDKQMIKGNIIGWDYAHYGDYMGYDDEYGIEGGEIYTTGEIVFECKRAIDWLIGVTE